MITSTKTTTIQYHWMDIVIIQSWTLLLIVQLNNNIINNIDVTTLILVDSHGLSDVISYRYGTLFIYDYIDMLLVSLINMLSY